jgi:hypothetical protein
MLNIPVHKGKANKKYVKMPPHSCENDYHQNTNNNKRW